MAFAQPLFLFALAALGIPVIIHLFNFRRYKKVYFTNVSFIADIKQESRKRSQLKHLLILLMRLLAIASLVFAFAQPYFTSGNQKRKHSGKQMVSIYIDNSFSMEALSTNGRLIDQAKLRALEILKTCNPSDQFQLLTNDFEGRHQRFLNPEEFKTMLEEVKISPSVRKISEVMRRQGDLLNGTSETNRSAFLISDFQSTSTDIAACKPDTTVAFYFMPLSAEKPNNLEIDSVWFDSPIRQPGQQARLTVRIRNSGGESLEKVPLKLTINNEQKAIASFSVEPGGQTDIVLPYTNNKAGIQSCSLEITDFPITWDDKYYFSYTLTSAIPVLCVNGENENHYLDALFGDDSTFHYKNAPVRQLDYSSFSRYSLIIFNGLTEISSGLSQEISRFVRNGGSLLFFPSPKADPAIYRPFFTSFNLPLFTALDTSRQQVANVNTESAVYADVFEKDAKGKAILPENADLPSVFRHFITSGQVHSENEVLLKLQNGGPFLGVTRVDKGLVYLCTSALDDKWNNFPKHTLFVPTVYKITLLSQPSAPLCYTSGSNVPLEVIADTNRNHEVYRIRKTDSDFEFIPETKNIGIATYLYPHDQIPDAGNYTLFTGSQPIQGLSFNYNRAESDLACLTAAELEGQLKKAGTRDFAVFHSQKKPVSQQIREMSLGTPAWKYFIILVLLFIAAEILLVRLLKD